MFDFGKKFQISSKFLLLQIGFGILFNVVLERIMAL